MQATAQVTSLPQFRLLRRGESQEDIFLPRRAHDKDAGHDVRVFVEQVLSEEIVASIAAGLLSRAMDDGFWIGGSGTVLLNRKPIVPVEPLVRRELGSWSNWVAYVCEKVDEFRELAGTRAVVLTPGASIILPTGFAVDLPVLEDPWTMVMKIVSRSGWGGKDRLCVTNAPGIIDCNYRNEVGVCLENRSRQTHIITHESRVAQALLEVGLSLDTEALYCFDDEQVEGERKGFGGTGTA
jgi:dUTP pyrophosphatase